MDAEVDLRPGGTYRIEMETDEMGTAEIVGTYQEVVPNTRLVFTWAWKNNLQLGSGETLVSVDLLEIEEGTEVKVHHSGFSNLDERDIHTQGWNSALDNLEVLFVGEEEDEEEFEEECCGSCEGGYIQPGHFSWNELMTNDVDGASTFYTGVFGWERAEHPDSPRPYSLLQQDGEDVGGMMQIPEPAIAPQWLAYVKVEDTDGIAAKAVKFGGTIVTKPFDVAGVGRIAILKDPQGAVFGVFTSEVFEDEEEED
jgi:predicted enzyme related to lactoylglutathione lyase